MAEGHRKGLDIGALRPRENVGPEAMGELQVHAQEAVPVACTPIARRLWFVDILLFKRHDLDSGYL